MINRNRTLKRHLRFLLIFPYGFPEKVNWVQVFDVISTGMRPIKELLRGKHDVDMLSNSGGLMCASQCSRNVMCVSRRRQETKGRYVVFSS